MIDYKAEYQKWLHSDAITEDERAAAVSGQTRSHRR